MNPSVHLVAGVRTVTRNKNGREASKAGAPVPFSVFAARMLFSSTLWINIEDRS